MAELQADPLELTMAVGGERRLGSGEAMDIVQPHARHHVLGVTHQATADDARAAVQAAKDAAQPWRDLSFDDRAAVFLKAADLLAGPWRQTLNGATLLGQSKTAFQAEIDAACELIDFWRYNVALRPADPRRAADLRGRGVEPGRPPARSRGSSTR